MAKAVFTAKRASEYDDLPEVRYHFPRTYLNAARETVGDWIVYYEPRRESTHPASRLGRQAYFASARIEYISEDPRRSDHYYAHIVDYLDFSTPVPFATVEGHYFESALVKADGTTNKGQFGRAIRLLPDHEYELIVQSGHMVDYPSEIGLKLNQFVPGLSDVPQEPYDRPIVESLTQRPFRDAAFRRNITRAYENTCAVTGLSLINGQGRSEVDAAHIRPVGGEHRGSDSVRNGVALSKTIHWMFDRGLIAFSEDYRLLLGAREIPPQLRGLLKTGEPLLLPNDPVKQPHPAHIRYHRESIFKG